MKSSLTRRGMCLATSALLTLGLSTGAIAQDAEVEFRWSHHEPLDSIVDKVTRAIADDIEAETQGRISIKVFPASQLGDWNEVSSQVQRGSVDFATQPVSSSTDPRLQIRVLPYSVMNYDEAEAAYFGDDPYLFDLMAEMMAESDLTALGVVAQGFGGAGFRECPDVDIFDIDADKGGLRVRFPPGNQSWENMVDAMGFAPTPVPWGELYLGLQTRLVDGQVGGQPSSTYANFRDVTDCWAQINTHFQNSFVFANAETFAELSAEDQDLIRDITARHAEGSLEMARAEDQQYMDLMKAEEGVVVLTPTDEELAEIATAVRTSVWPLMDDVIGEDIMNTMKERAGLIE
ncbi:TRAP transporter substrate-binding protein DctP [Tropicimonas sp. IMCC34011]|uniref:TRAP transporter substrate-binding protein DctP n=1 Tax=Tropicimonas sp. IMCC34011 TaxID=2248759 RepID=UPI000E24C81E|nr:TRAP transporter substrate-binding protein DctP [Tropicimonas sp. IMCC34011]